MTVQIIITDPHRMEPGDLKGYAELLLAYAARTPGLGRCVPEIVSTELPQWARYAETTAPIPAATLEEPASTVPPQPTADAQTGGPASTVPPPPAAVTPDRDSRGLPWDARIHASTRTLNADGTWRNRRGVDPATVTAVEAELRAILAAPAPATETGQPAAVTPDAAQAFGAVPPPPAATTPPAPITFPQLVRAASERVAKGLLTQPAIVQACQAAGLPDLPALALRPDLVATVATALGIEVSP